LKKTLTGFQRQMALPGDKNLAQLTQEFEIYRRHQITTGNDSWCSELLEYLANRANPLNLW